MSTPGTELAVMDEAQAAALAGMVDRDDTTGASIPILKINYVSTEEGSKFPKGTWLIGQQKDSEGNITDQGKEVKGLVILAVRNRFSYYNKKNTASNCSSPFHTQGEPVKGNKYHNACGSTCPYRAKDLNPRCKAQKVVFGVAITADGEALDCMAYIQGQSYVPFTDYYKTLTKRRVKAGFADIPPFCHLTLLASEKQKYDATVYFSGVFTQGPMFTMEQIKGFEVRRDAAKGMIDRLNQMYGEPRNGSARADEGGAPLSDRPPISDDVAAGAIDVTPPAKAAPVAPAPVAPATPASAEDSEFDIEAAINAALAKAPKVAA